MKAADDEEERSKYSLALPSVDDGAAAVKAAAGW